MKSSIEFQAGKIIPTAPMSSISPVTPDCPLEVLRWKEPKRHHIVETAHKHEFDEIILFEKGGGQHFINGTWHFIADYSVHFVKKGATHFLNRSVTSSGGSVLFLSEHIRLDPQIPFKHLFFLESAPVLNLSEDAFSKIWLIYGQLFKEAREKQFFYRKQTILSWFNAFIINLAEHYRQQYPQPADQTTSAQKLFTQFTQLLKDNYKNSKSVNFYAQRLFITPKYLHDVCKKQSGKSPVEFISEYVIQLALPQLNNHDYPIKQIADNLGFSDASYFSRFVKKQTGKSPLEWRNT